MSASTDLKDGERTVVRPVTPGMVRQLASDVAILEEEKSMSLFEALRRYPKAAAWSVFLSTAVIMEGYDIGLLGSFYGFPAFKKKYGDHIGPDKYNISAAWQSGLTQAMHCGQIIGLMINGWATERFGLKKTQCAALVFMSGFIFLQYFAPSIGVLCVGEALIGIPLGVFLTLSNVYAADTCPTVLRPYLTSYVNLCWVIGKFISTGVLRGFVNNSTQWAYRIPFAIQWGWAPPILVGTFFAPESPYWLVRKGRLEDARRSLQRLWTNPAADQLDAELAMMCRTNEHERSMQKSTSYLDCFKGVNLRRTEIACAVYSIQPLCGYALTGAATYFLEQAGMSSENSFNMTLGNLAIAFVGGIFVWPCLAWFGRRTLFIYGLIGIFAVQMAIGFVAIPRTDSATAWVTGVMLLVFNAIYSLSIGPVAYTIVPEIPSARLRSKTASLARNAYNVFSIANNILTNYQINETSWNWKGKTGFFWAGSCVLCYVWAYFRLPETKNRTFAELNVLFEAGVPARQFQKSRVDLASFVVENEHTEASEEPPKS